jgi:hypothetical protein
MPADGFRLAVINGSDLGAALSARARLQDHFVARQPLRALQG